MISLCMIIRDEAEHIPRFLASTKGLWDELCVADTGSTDHSKELLADAGARTIDYPWNDNFAAARNASMSIATGDWIIYLDPDEFPEQKLIEEIRALELDPLSGAATFFMRSLRQQNDVHEQRLLRIFRRNPEIQFEYRIHESAEKSVRHMLDTHKLACKNLSGHAVHVGYQPNLMESRKKRERDQRILQSTLAENPKDLYSAFKLLELANFWLDKNLSEKVAGDLHHQLIELPPEGLRKYHWGADLLARLSRTRYLSAPSEALKLLQGYQVAPTLDFMETRGLFHEMAGDAVSAREDFIAALDICNQALHPEAMRIPSMLGLCRLALAQEDMEGASVFASQSVKYNPRNLNALRYDLMITQLSAGDEALQFRMIELRDAYNIGDELKCLAPEFGLDAAALSVFTS